MMLSRFPRLTSTMYKYLMKGSSLDVGSLGVYYSTIKSPAVEELNLDYKLLYEKKDQDLLQMAVKLGEVQQSLKDAEKYQLLLGLVSRIDRLEKNLCPDDVILPKPRKERWAVILSQEDNKIVQEILGKLKKSGISVNLFCRIVSQLCQERNERAGHPAAVPLPHPVDDVTIENALKIMSIVPDKCVKDSIKVIVDSLRSGDLEPAENA